MEKKEFDNIFKKVNSISFKLFPSLEEVLDDFYKKNNFPKPKRIKKLSFGLIAEFEKEDYALIYLRDAKNNINSKVNPLSCKSGICKSPRLIYTLEGRLKGEDVYLKTEIKYPKQYGNTFSFFQESMIEQIPIKIRKSRQVKREDNNKKYWFLDD